MPPSDIAPVICTVHVPISPALAFRDFVHDFNTWWPQAYTWSGDVLDMIAIEPHVGGTCFERGPHGFRIDWGRVLVWEPSTRVAFTWQISPARVPVPDPAQASEVEVRFGAAAEAGQAQVTLEHRHFARHGEGAATYREALASPEGWPYILDQYAAFCGRERTDHGSAI